MQNASNNVSSGLSTNEVIHAPTKEDPHGSAAAAVVHFPGVLQLRDGGATHSEPINVNRIRGAAHRVLIFGCMDAVEVAVPHKNIETSLRSRWMGRDTGRAQILQVFVLVLHALHDPDLACRDMPVFDLLEDQGRLLPVAADVALWGGVGHGDSTADDTAAGDFLMAAMTNF